MKSHENGNPRGCYKALALVTASFIFKFKFIDNSY